MKKIKVKHFGLSLINIFTFALSCLFSTFSWNYKVDVFANKMVSYTQYSVKDKYVFPYLSISPKTEEFDFGKIFSYVCYNHYIPNYCCKTTTTLSYLDFSADVSIVSQPTFWSTEYKKNDNTYYKLDHSSYFLKYKSEYNSHGYDAFFYLSQPLANYICEELKVSEEELMTRVFNFNDKNGETKTAFVSNIVVDHLGLSDYQTEREGFFVLSYLLFDPRSKANYDISFDIQMKINPRGNTEVIENCLSFNSLENYDYSFYTYNKSENKLIENQDLNQQFSQMNHNGDLLAKIFCYGFLILFVGYFVFQIIYFKKLQEYILISSLICLILFAIFGIIFSFLFNYYMFGLFALVFLGLESAFFIQNIFVKKANKHSFKEKGGIKNEESAPFYSIEV